ncbi:Protein N-terminal methyltransferase [Ascochyta rabiei]|uniref:Alpha N-terminal protein methyltransferase 1 n=1 Tax=Didymella rabiei TaxID=5454 RepID=A0A162XKK4_DIDRA|nr:Protein N-terminal methyltransferase [Ascochyta rabiei]KZM19600.1 methyltransferase [Ascochyta rabiei]UPX13838.1 Protein N-terminal methyltransferase [Ascochyta rabiei]
MAQGMDADPPLTSLDPERPDASINVSASLAYWEGVTSDNNGMLGGFPQTSRIDLQGSSNFLTKLRRVRAGQATATRQALPLLDRVADCGAGIGRITKGLLLGVGRRVDIVEPVKKFTDELVKELENTEEDAAGGDAGRGQVGEVFNLGLQDWIPEAGAYNLIWNQWCVGHLTDAQLVTYLERCKNGLVKPADGEERSEAWIVVKENLSTDIRHKDIYDEEDSSVTRSDDKFRKLFKDAGLKIVATEQQRGMPKELYPVRIYALRPQ